MDAQMEEGFMNVSIVSFNSYCQLLLLQCLSPVSLAAQFQWSAWTGLAGFGLFIVVWLGKLHSHKPCLSFLKSLMAVVVSEIHI